MTELYRGPWDPPKSKEQKDLYHPKFPDVNGRIRPDYGQVVVRVVKPEQVTVQTK